MDDTIITLAFVVFSQVELWMVAFIIYCLMLMKIMGSYRRICRHNLSISIYKNSYTYFLCILGVINKTVHIHVIDIKRKSLYFIKHTYKIYNFQAIYSLVLLSKSFVISNFFAWTTELWDNGVPLYFKNICINWHSFITWFFDIYNLMQSAIVFL